jgi:hypothetical protein
MSARTDPRGGYQATGIPTATVNAIRLSQVADDEAMHRYRCTGPLLNAVARCSPNS